MGYARQLGWLHSAPRNDPKNRETRADKIVREGGSPLLPDIGEACYLADWWADMGHCLSGAMGPVPLTSEEIFSWQRMTGIRLTPWEFRTIRAMSMGYVAALRAGEEPGCPAPYGGQTLDDNRNRVSKMLAGAFRAFGKKRRR